MGIGAASFWKDYDAQTRYKHLSGQKEQGISFRALTDAQRTSQPREHLCPTVVAATYVREYVAPRSPPPTKEIIASLSPAHKCEVELLTKAYLSSHIDEKTSCCDVCLWWE